MIKKAIVIGAGIGGLAVAVRLKLKGYSVQVFEQAASCGGKLTDFQLGNYRFDFGPSLFTMPQYVTEIFKLAGKDPKDYFEFEETSEACRYFYQDGTRFIAKTDEVQFIKEASKTFGVGEGILKAFMAENRKIFENAGKVFLENSLHKAKTWMSKDVLSSLTHSYVLDMLKSMHKVTNQRIKEPRLVQLFDRYATYNGSNPFEASSILNSISSLEHQYGTYFPKLGMVHIAKSIELLGKELGVEYNYNTKVQSISKQNKKVQGVIVNGEFIESDIVVSNMDVQFTYDQLLNEPSKRLEKREKSSSAVIFYWGINKKFEELGLHNIFFSENYQEEFQDIFKKKRIPLDPTIYVNISSKHQPKDASEVGENWFTMINVPADFDQDWDTEIKTLRKTVISKLSKQLGVEIEKLIEEEFIADPRTIRDKTLSHRGALYGTSSNHWLSAFLRHPNFSSKWKGLYFVGGTVHPGGGIPLCLLSAKIVSDIVI